MAALLLRKSVFFYIILSFVFYPVPLQAQIPRLTKKITKKRTVVIGLHDGKVKKDRVEKVTDSVRGHLKTRSKFTVTSKETIYQFFEMNPDLLVRLDPANPLNSYLDQAKEFYNNFAFKEATQLLTNIIETYRSSPAVQREVFLLTDAYLMLGNIYLGAKNKKKAEEALREAIRLNPEGRITQMKYPPKTIRVFEKVREEYLGKVASVEVEVTTSPHKAKVFLNGIYKGESPLAIQKMTPGEHFLLVKREGYQSNFKRLNLGKEKVSTKLSLAKTGDSNLFSQGLHVKNPNDLPKMVRLASSIGSHLQADKVVFVSIQEIGWHHKITARMFDQKYGAAHKNKTVEVVDLPRDASAAAKLLADDLDQKVDIDLAKNPKKYAESDVIVVGTKKKKSFLKSPILWTVVGVLVAGGAASAILLTGGGGEDSNTSTISVDGSAGRTP